MNISTLTNWCFLLDFHQVSILSMRDLGSCYYGWWILHPIAHFSCRTRYWKYRGNLHIIGLSYNRPLMFEVGCFYGIMVQETYLKKQGWVLLFSDPCDVSDDVMTGHGDIGTGDMLLVFPCIRFVLYRRLSLKLEKRACVIFPYGWVNSDQINYTHKRQFSHFWQLVSNDVSTATRNIRKTFIIVLIL